MVHGKPWQTAAIRGKPRQYFLTFSFIREIRAHLSSEAFCPQRRRIRGQKISLKTTPKNRKRNKGNNIDKHWPKSTFQSVTNDLLLLFENRKKARKHWLVTLVTLVTLETAPSRGKKVRQNGTGFVPPAMSRRR